MARSSLACKRPIERPYRRAEAAAMCQGAGAATGGGRAAGAVSAASPSRHRSADAEPARLPDAPTEACREELQAWVTNILAKEERSGQSMVDVLRHNRNYRNPHFMEKIVAEFGISQYGTCFEPAVFDAASMPPEDFLPSVRQKMQRQVRMVIPPGRRSGCLLSSAGGHGLHWSACLTLDPPRGHAASSHVLVGLVTAAAARRGPRLRFVSCRRQTGRVNAQSRECPWRRSASIPLRRLHLQRVAWRRQRRPSGASGTCECELCLGAPGALVWLLIAVRDADRASAAKQQVLAPSQSQAASSRKCQARRLRDTAAPTRRTHARSTR